MAVSQNLPIFILAKLAIKANWIWLEFVLSLAKMAIAFRCLE